MPEAYLLLCSILPAQESYRFPYILLDILLALGAVLFVMTLYYLIFIRRKRMVTGRISKNMLLDAITNQCESSIAIYEIDGSNIKTLYSSPNMAKLSQRTQEEYDKDLSAAQSPVYAFVYAEDRQRLIEHIAAASPLGLPFNITYRFVKKNGEVAWMHLSASQIAVKGHSHIYCATFSNAPDEARVFEALLNDTTTAVYVCDRKENKILFINASMKALIKREGETFIGKTCHDVFLGCKQPCPTCPMRCGSFDESGTLDYQFSAGTREYTIKSKLIIWNEIPAFIQYIDEDSARIRAQRLMLDLLRSFPGGAGVFSFSRGELKAEYLNDGFYGIFDNPPKNRYHICSEHFSELIHPDDIKLLINEIINTKRESRLAGCTIRMLDGESKYRWVFVKTASADNTSGRRMYYASFSDVNEMKTNELIAQSRYNNQLAYLAYLKKNALYSVRVNLTENAFSEEIINDKRYLPMDLSSCDNGFRQLCSLVRLADRQSDFDRMFDRRRLLEGFDMGQNHFECEFKESIKSGELRWVKASIDLARNPLSGDIEGMLIISDIHRSKTDELVLDKVVSEDIDYLAYLDTATGIVHMLRAKSIYIKSLTSLDMSYGAVIDRLTDDYVNEDEIAKCKALMKIENVIAQLEKGSEFSAIIDIKQEITNRRAFLKITSSWLDETHEIIMFRCKNVTDILFEEHRQKQELEKALEDSKSASRAKSEFLSKMSHEIRTPMNAIVGMARLAQSGTKDQDELTRCLGTIERSSDYLLSIINDILDMSQIESGKFRLKPEWHTLSDVIEPCADMFISSLTDKHIRFIYPHTDKLHPDFVFRIDLMRMKQIFMNLIGNAAKFTPEGGEIEVKLRNISVNDSVCLDEFSVRDTGCGMSQEFVQHLFEPFEQEQNEYYSSVKGTGLGLSLVKNIVDEMGGTITVKTALQKGSTFIVQLPLEYRIKDSEEVKPVKPVEKKLSGLKLLLAEDNDVNTEVASKLLKSAGAEVAHAENGEKALQLFRLSQQGEYAAILMDIRMPVMDGIEAAKSIRALERCDAKNIPIIAMTADVFFCRKEMAIEAGMNDTVIKPIDPQKLFDALEFWVYGKKSGAQ